MDEFSILIGMNSHIPRSSLLRVLPAALLAFNLSAQDDDIIQLSPFVVDASQQRGYLAQTAISGTALNTPLRDIPITIRVITEDFMNDTFARDLQSAVAYVPGVTPSGETREEGIFNIRGFRVNRSKRNGLTALYAQDMTNVARVEVVKGPNSILFGETSPGGIINYVTRRPMPERFQSIDLSIGSFGYFRGQVESTGPLWRGERGSKLLYRIDASYQRQDGWRDFEDGERYFISPMIEWFPYPETAISLQFEWIDRDERQLANHHLYSTQLAPHGWRHRRQKEGRQHSAFSIFASNPTML